MSAVPDPSTDTPASPSSQELELSIPQLLGTAMQLHRDQELDAAEKCYRAVL